MPDDTPSHRATGIPVTSSGKYTMSKPQKSSKESKKQALLSPKEKKVAKLVRKHAGDATPLIVKGT